VLSTAIIKTPDEGTYLGRMVFHPRNPGTAVPKADGLTMLY